MDAPRGRIIQQILILIALLVGIAMSMVVGFVWFSAERQDEVALEQSVESVRDAVHRRLEQIGVVAKDYSWWNDAAINLDLAYDAEWAHTNVGYYPFDLHSFELSFVIGRDGRTLYSQRDGEQTSLEAATVLSGGLARLVEQARTAPADEPRPATGFLAAEGGIVMVGASAVTPEDSAAVAIADGPRVVIVYVKRLTQAFLDEVAEPLPLQGLSLTAATEAGTSPAQMALTAPDGTRLGRLTWHPHQPGQEFLSSVTPALAIAISIFTVFAIVVLRHVRQSTGAIQASEARFRDVVDAASDWIWETDADLRLTFLSERFAALAGGTPGSFLGMPVGELFHAGEHVGRWRQHLDDLARWRPFRDVLCVCEDAGGLTRTVRIAGKPIRGAANEPLGYRGTATDITAEIAADRRAQYLALHDPLTELPNRELLRERLEQAIADVGRRGNMAALLLLDLDRFKDINDTLGHPAGDLLLRSCAERLSACVREVDTVARIGGDEFAIIQAGISSASEVQLLTQRMLNVFQETFDLDGHEALVTTSIGVAMIPGDGSIAGRLLQNADIALYRAKEEGRNAVRFFEPEMDARLQKRKALERDLRLAITRDELELFYQPKFALADRQLSGVEALVRWNHPDRGLVPPGEFIGVAEESGLIIALGEWVLRTACRQAADWPGVLVSVNVSPVQFRQPGLVDVVQKAIADAGLEPDRLELEITESVLVQHPDAAARMLREFKELKVQVAMDDFGTGYSSLSYLQRFPFDKIKIDRSFVGAMDIETSARAIVRAVISLAGNLEMETCAEGVETEHQLDMLMREGCTEVQGYLFGKPMPLGEFERKHVHRASPSVEPVAS